MPNMFLIAVGYGGYISPVKLVIVLALMYAWFWVVSWVYADANSVGLLSDVRTAIVLGAGAAGVLIWLLFPVFIVGMLIYLIAVAASTLAYVKLRNLNVPEFEKVLTADHIKGLIGKKEENVTTAEDFVFITTNNNEVPQPQPKTPEFFGYKMAHDILSDAIWRRASDMVFTPTQQNYQLVYYVDGAAIKQPEVAKDQVGYFIRFVKNLGGLNTEEKRKPQKGSFRVFQNKKNIEWEVQTAGSTAGEKIMIKQMAEQNITQLTDLGLTDTQYEQLCNIDEAGQGLYIISGSKKSGVTSTLYSLLRNHDAFLNNICTVETKPTSSLPNIAQNVFSLSDTGTTTFAKKLLSIVRMDPDIIGIAECNDSETAKVACEAAKSGKTVYIIIEAENSVKALVRWIKLVGDKDAAVKNLTGISNQRLLRKLCDNCKQGYEPNKEILRKFNIAAEKAKVFYKAGKVIYDKKGRPSPCEICQQTGYLGRMAIFEVIFFDDQLRDALAKVASSSEINTEFRRARMLYLQEQALRKVMEGKTAINEMVRILSSSKKPSGKRAR